MRAGRSGCARGGEAEAEAEALREQVKDLKQRLAEAEQRNRELALRISVLEGMDSYRDQKATADVLQELIDVKMKLAETVAALDQQGAGRR